MDHASTALPAMLVASEPLDRTVNVGQPLTVDEVVAVARRGIPAVLGAPARATVAASRAVVDELVAQRQAVYGVTTGFGKFSDVSISPDEVEQLQRNLIMSHASGVGEPLPAEVVRAMILLRAQALSMGYSGIRPVTLDLLLDLLAQGVHPIIPEQGSLGASGDLAPLAHLALVLIGRGEAEFRGRRLPGGEALAQAGLKPVTLGAKEGLALINGTQAMTGLGSLALYDATMLLRVADICAAMTAEALGGIPAAWDDRVQAVRLHPGQRTAAANLRLLVQGSGLVTRPGQVRVQDPYTLRCLPQVHGASRTALEHIAQVVGWEVNAVTDNPLVFPESGDIISGGNFHGQPVALAMDYLGIAVSELANIAERRIERLVNPQLSGLPPFLTQQGGLHSGLMIPQYVAASLVSENKILAHPASVDSIPSSANQEDHVSMGTTAARKARKIVTNVLHVLAIELLCAAQALEFVGPRALGAGTGAAYRAVRSVVTPLTHDREPAPDIQALAGIIASGELLARVQAATGPLA